MCLCMAIERCDVRSKQNITVPCLMATRRTQNASFGELNDHHLCWPFVLHSRCPGPFLFWVLLFLFVLFFVLCASFFTHILQDPLGNSLKLHTLDAQRNAHTVTLCSRQNILEQPKKSFYFVISCFAMVSFIGSLTHTNHIAHFSASHEMK